MGKDQQSTKNLNAALRQLQNLDNKNNCQIIRNLKNIADIVGLEYENINRFDLEIKIAEKLGLKINNKDELEKFKLAQNNNHAHLLRKIDNAVEELFTKNTQYLGGWQENYKAGKLPRQIVENASEKK